MDPERWARIKDAFSCAVALEPQRAQDALRTLCEGDEQLLAEVTRLVEEHFRLASGDANPRPTSTTTFESETEPAGGRFRVMARLGSGTFGDVYHVVDRTIGADVALKVLRNAAGLWHFKREFRDLAGVRHPNIVSLHELILDTDRWMFTMEYVDGVILPEFLERSSPGERDARLRASLVQLAEGLHALHDRGLLHRDLKPSNALVTLSGRVVLLDFGLVRHVDMHPAAEATFAGTPDYMSPEQAAGGALTEASDWYAVGVMLYRLLTKAAPFQGGFLEVLRRKQVDLPVPPNEIRPEVAGDLSELCMRLLDRDPHLRAGYDDVVGLVRRAPRVARESPRPRLLGRDAQLDTLRAAYTAAGDDALVTVHVTGSSGIGKTILIREFLESVKAGDPTALLLAGRCYEGESVPYQGVDDLIDHLAYYLRHLPKDRVDQVLPRNFAVLARMFPVLAQFGQADLRMPALDSTELRRRAVAALRDLFGRLAERHRVVLVIDDLQWGDRDGCEFLSDLKVSLDAPPVLLLLSYRSEDIAGSPWLRSLRQAVTTDAPGSRVLLELDVLTGPETMRLATSLAGSDLLLDGNALERIAVESEGNPFLVHEIVRWVVAHGSTASLPEAFSIEDVIRARARGLSPDASRLLELVAVAGQPTDLAVFRAGSGLGRALDARDELLAGRLARSRLTEGREELEVYHDRIRATIVQAMDAATLAARHLDLARALEAGGADDAERLANHFELAGDPRRAAGYALRAAARAFDALAFNKAERFYGRAIATGVLTGDALRDATCRHGDALAGAGRGAEAAHAYLEAAASADKRSAARLKSSAASQYLRCGYVEQGGALLDGLLLELGVRPARSRIGVFASIARLRAQLWLRGLDFQERDAANPIAEEERLRLDLCWTGTLGMILIDPLRSVEFSARHLWLALRAGDARRISTALSVEAALRAMTVPEGHAPVVARMAARGAGMADRLDDPYAKAVALISSCVLAYLRGTWRDASRLGDEAIAILQSQCTNVAWELSMATIMSSIGRQARGEWAENRRRLPAFIRDAEARGDLNAGLSLRILANTYVIDAAADEPDRALEQSRQALEKWPGDPSAFQQVGALTSEIDLALYADRPADAWATVEKAWPLVERSQVLRVSTSFAFAIFARGRAAIAMAAQAHLNDHERARFVAQAESDATALLRKGPGWSRGLAGLLQAGLATVHGDAALARRTLSEAAPALEAAELTPFHMAALSRRAECERETDTGPLRSVVAAWAAREGVVRMERIVAGLAPGNYAEFAKNP